MAWKSSVFKEVRRSLTGAIGRPNIGYLINNNDNNIQLHWFGIPVHAKMKNGLQKDMYFIEAGMC
jgi:hypothetical protein